MSYGTPEFWTAYAAYVGESMGRHKAAIERLGGLLAPLLDLGCGQIAEGHKISLGKEAKHYRGVDLEPPAFTEHPEVFVQADYRDVQKLKKALGGFKPFCILSLFSIEPTASPNENAAYYAELLKAFPTARKIISAGFYYEGKERLEIIDEAGGLQSHQSIGTMITGELHEYRLLEKAPSKLFGPDVVEVWRMITRNA